MITALSLAFVALELAALGVAARSAWLMVGPGDDGTAATGWRAMRLGWVAFGVAVAGAVCTAGLPPVPTYFAVPLALTLTTSLAFGGIGSVLADGRQMAEDRAAGVVDDDE